MSLASHDATLWMNELFLSLLLKQQLFSHGSLHQNRHFTCKNLPNKRRSVDDNVTGISEKNNASHKYFWHTITKSIYVCPSIQLVCFNAFLNVDANIKLNKLILFVTSTGVFVTACWTWSLDDI